MSFLDQAADVGGPGHDVGPQELETGDTLDSHPIHVDGVLLPIIVMLSNKLISVHHVTVCCTPSL